MRGGHEVVAPLAAGAGARAQLSNQQATDSLGEDRRVGFRGAAPIAAVKSDLPIKLSIRSLTSPHPTRAHAGRIAGASRGEF